MRKYNSYIVLVDGIPFPNMNLAAAVIGGTNQQLRYNFRDILDTHSYATGRATIAGRTVQLFVYGKHSLSSISSIKKWKEDKDEDTL